MKPPPLRPLLACVGLAAALAGCARPQPTLAPTRPPDVVVDTPTVREVIDYEDFTGRTEAIASVPVQAQATGYLGDVHFKDGAVVKRGDPLFTISPELYQAEFEKAEAAVGQAKATLTKAQRDYDRAVALYKGSPGAISREELDTLEGSRDEAAAAVTVAEKTRNLAKVNLGYCEVKAPMAGRLSKRFVHPGTQVTPATVLTTLVALNPIFVNFDVDDRTRLWLNRLDIEKGQSPADAHDVVVQVGLPDEEGYSLSGTIDFQEPSYDPATGTVRVRAVVQNDDGLLSPGLFVRVRFPVGPPHRAVLVPEEAVGTDQGRKYVYVVTDQGEVAYRPVELGRPFDNLREVLKDGVRPTDRVIVSGLQRVRPGAKVNAKPAEKRTPALPPASGPSAAPPATARDDQPPKANGGN